LNCGKLEPDAVMETEKDILKNVCHFRVIFECRWHLAVKIDDAAFFPAVLLVVMNMLQHGT